jgi:hypothetical protein
MKSRRVRLCLRLMAVGALATSTLGTTVNVPVILAAVPTCGTNGPAVGNTCTYTFIGQEDNFIPPSGVSSVSVVAIGGSGGNEDPRDQGNNFTGGAGAHVIASGISVIADQIYSVTVGENGLLGDVTLCGKAPLAGGFNGGGTASGCGAGSGGGASVVSSDSPPTTAGVLVVAGGGGGAGEFGGNGGGAASGNTANGGAGPNCGGVADGGGGGTTTTNGAGGAGSGGDPGTDGSFLQGGNGGDRFNGGYAAGGGAGYHGGGGGGSADNDLCGGPGGAGSSYAASGTATYTPDTTGTPGIVISWSPTAAAAVGLHVAVAHGWTTMTWRSTSHVLGFNVYRGSQKLNRTLVKGTPQRYTFRIHAVVRHPVLRAVMQR